jgi:hypothetical protein
MVNLNRRRKQEELLRVLQQSCLLKKRKDANEDEGCRRQDGDQQRVNIVYSHIDDLVRRGNLVNVGETTKPKPKQLINYALHQKTSTVVAYLHRGRF